MSYFSPRDKVVYKDETFICTESSIGRLEMFWLWSVNMDDCTAIRCGEIINGRHGFEKIYKGDFQRWIKKIRNRDYDTMNSYLRQARDLLKQAETIRKTYGFEEPNNE